MIKLSRRYFIKFLTLIYISLLLKVRPNISWSKPVKPNKLGVSRDGLSDIYLSKGGSAEENTRKVIELMGGITKIVKQDDIVVIKPNAQWWNQGMTNTDSIREFIRQVLAIPKFEGEIIIAENHQYQEDASRGWNTDMPNGDYNLNQLVEYFNKNGSKNVTKYHWHCGGQNRNVGQGDAYGNSVVNGPADGDGYVWRNDMIYECTSGRKTLMSYPIFTSNYSGITIDLMKGPWKEGKYLDIKVKLINFAGLNHHSGWAGVTSSIKNYLGIVDMTCGYHGENPKGFYNFHYVGGYEQKNPYLEKIKNTLGIGYFDHFNGGPVGYFMRNVRMADLNVVTADWIGYASRTDPELSAKPRVILASTDPVALDYYATKYVLLPTTPKDAVNKWGEKVYPLNDPDVKRGYKKGFLRWYLRECQSEGIGNLEESKFRVNLYDYKA